MVPTQKRKRNNGGILLDEPFTRIVNSVVKTIPVIGGSAFTTYCLLAMHADGYGECWPHVETLAREQGVNVKTIHRNLNTLREAKLIVSRRMRYGNKYAVVAFASAATLVGYTDERPKSKLQDHPAQESVQDGPEMSDLDAEEPPDLSDLESEEPPYFPFQSFQNWPCRIAGNVPSIELDPIEIRTKEPELRASQVATESGEYPERDQRKDLFEMSASGAHLTEGYSQQGNGTKSGTTTKNSCVSNSLYSKAEMGATVPYALDQLIAERNNEYWTSDRDKHFMTVWRLHPLRGDQRDARRAWREAIDDYADFPGSTNGCAIGLALTGAIEDGGDFPAQLTRIGEWIQGDYEDSSFAFNLSPFGTVIEPPSLGGGS